jgi:hypothetical protein
VTAAVSIAERAMLSGHPSALARLFAPELRPELLRRFELARAGSPDMQEVVDEFLAWVARNAS